MWRRAKGVQICDSAGRVNTVLPAPGGRISIQSRLPGNTWIVLPPDRRYAEFMPCLRIFMRVRPVYAGRGEAASHLRLNMPLTSKFPTSRCNPESSRQGPPGDARRSCSALRTARRAGFLCPALSAALLFAAQPAFAADAPPAYRDPARSPAARVADLPELPAPPEALCTLRWAGGRSGRASSTAGKARPISSQTKAVNWPRFRGKGNTTGSMMLP
jgi:hypothetical protein